MRARAENGRELAEELSHGAEYIDGQQLAGASGGAALAVASVAPVASGSAGRSGWAGRSWDGPEDGALRGLAGWPRFAGVTFRSGAAGELALHLLGDLGADRRQPDGWPWRSLRPRTPWPAALRLAAELHDALRLGVGEAGRRADDLGAADDAAHVRELLVDAQGVDRERRDGHDGDQSAEDDDDEPPVVYEHETATRVHAGHVPTAYVPLNTRARLTRTLVTRGGARYGAARRGLAWFF